MAHIAANSQIHEHTVTELAEFACQLNRWASLRIPFFFMIDFEMRKPWAAPLDLLNQNNPLVWFKFPNHSNCISNGTLHGHASYRKFPVSYAEYLHRFQTAMHHLKAGNTYLINLTCKTLLELNASWYNLFLKARAPYKIYVPGCCLCFSPETFVTIKRNIIRTFPMKGTIDAAAPDAASSILNNEKETAEHVTIVDLLRNDLSRVASKVKVERFRYLTEIRAGSRRLLQVSSEISGQLPPGYLASLGDMLISLLPAGSVSGAPKEMTCRIISEAEQEERGYFTGVCGIFDGENLESTVMIRYLEFTPHGVFYRSGGGITAKSDPEMEYREMIQKVYVPVN